MHFKFAYSYFVFIHLEIHSYMYAPNAGKMNSHVVLIMRSSMFNRSRRILNSLIIYIVHLWFRCCSTGSKQILISKLLSNRPTFKKKYPQPSWGEGGFGYDVTGSVSKPRMKWISYTGDKGFRSLSFIFQRCYLQEFYLLYSFSLSSPTFCLFLSSLYVCILCQQQSRSKTTVVRQSEEKLYKYYFKNKSN